MKTITVVVPCYNEEVTVKPYYDAIKGIWYQLSGYDLELIFVDDGSKDRTADLIRALAEKDSSVRYTSFSRNFGKEAAIFCGLQQATGDCVVVMDADLQHPVETIPLMVKEWERGFDVVEGIKTTRGKETASHGLCAKMFYSFISKTVGYDMSNSSDFKLIDRKVVDTLNQFEERITFFRALTFWVGFPSTKVEYEVHERVAGTSKWSGRSLIKYALHNITSFTYAPLRCITWTGLIVLLIGLALSIDAVISHFKGIAVGGYPSLVILLLLSTGAIILSLGIIAIYLIRIYEEVKRRPRYIVQDKN